MISIQSVQDFIGICEATSAKAVAQTQQRCLASIGEANDRGMLHSSVAALQMDKNAADTFGEFAAELFASLKNLNDAEPTRNPPARRQQVLDLLESTMRELGRAVFAARAPYRATCARGLLNTSLLDDAPSLAVVDRAVTEYRGRLGLAVTKLGNTEAMQPPTQNFTFTNHGSIANLQTGHGSSATVTQSVAAHVSPGEVKAALDALIQAFQQAQGMPQGQRAEVVDVLEQVKAEADKDKPNRLKLGGLLGSVGSTIQTVGAAPQAWATVVGWFEMLKSMVG